MKICIKENCENTVPNFFTDENGKKHNCQRRKFCFSCSPYGEHNTKNLNIKRNSVCKICGGASQKGRSKCYSCYFSEAKIRKSKIVYKIMGYDCWYCGYDRGCEGQSILEFHHIDPNQKLFQLTTREFVGKKWVSVWKEMQKCVSLCCRCHRELHAGLIFEEKIKKIYKNKWKKIISTHSSTVEQKAHNF